MIFYYEKGRFGGPCYLAGVMFGNVVQNVKICQTKRKAEMFPPHELIEITGQQVLLKLAFVRLIPGCVVSLTGSTK